MQHTSGTRKIDALDVVEFWSHHELQFSLLVEWGDYGIAHLPLAVAVHVVGTVSAHACLFVVEHAHSQGILYVSETDACRLLDLLVAKRLTHIELYVVGVGVFQATIAEMYVQRVGSVADVDEMGQ